MTDQHTRPSGELVPGSTVGAPDEGPLFPLSPHRLRTTDTDPKAARRAERQVATMFVLSALLVIAFVVAYVVVSPAELVNLGPVGVVSKSNVLLGVTFGLSVFLIGAGAIHWAKKLMAEEEMVGERHTGPPPTPRRARWPGPTTRPAWPSRASSQRPLLRRTMIGALALFPVPLVDVPEGPRTAAGHRSFGETIWTAGERIVVDVTRAAHPAVRHPGGGPGHRAARGPRGGPEVRPEPQRPREGLGHPRADAAGGDPFAAG